MVQYLSDKGYHRTNRFLLRWKGWLFITIPIVFMPVLLLHHFSKEACCAYTMLIVILFWVFNILPVPGTGLIPVALFPLFNVATPILITTSYMKDVNLLLLGGLAAGVAIEYSNLHSRIALRILSWFGTSPRCLFAGFLIPTVLMSMWINNATATAMMVPIADAVLKELYPGDITPEPPPEPGAGVTPSKTGDVEDSSPAPDPLKEAKNMRSGLMLTISYAASLGGTGTLIGTGCNLVMVEALNIEYRKNEIKITYFNWMLFAIPNMLICCFALWLLMQIISIGCKATFKRNKELTDKQTALKDSIKQKHANLGPMTYHQKVVAIIFVILIIAWIFREPGFFPGWDEFMYPNIQVSDSAAAIILISLLFIIPEFSDYWCFNIMDRKLDQPPPTALTWRVMHARIGWGILFVLGGGYAMAEACRVSGLCWAISDELEVLEVLPAPVICLIVMILASLMTQITSNSATAVTFAPLLIALADAVKVHPTYLVLPVIICCSFAFAFPISTPANAIAFKKAKISITKMMLSGCFLCLVCILITFAMTHALGPFIFDMEKNPRPERIQ